MLIQLCGAGNALYTLVMFKPRAALSETRIHDAALHYLQRYAASEVQLRRVLERKLVRARLRGEDVPAEAAGWIEKSIQKCLANGFVNDRTYAEQKIQSLRRQGRSQAFIIRTLQQKGVQTELVQDLLPSDDESDLTAARRYVARRRLGRDPGPEAVQKDLARLMRAGFSLRVARAALMPADGD